MAVSKYVFGTWGIYGAEPSLQLKGVVLWHSPEKLPELAGTTAGDYSNWRKLDISKPEDVALIVEFWTKRAEDQVVEGLPA